MRVALKGFHLSLACEPVSRPPAANCIYIEVSKYSLGAFTDRCCSWCSFSSGDSNFVPALDGHKLCCWCSLFVCLFVCYEIRIKPHLPVTFPVRPSPSAIYYIFVDVARNSTLRIVGKQTVLFRCWIGSTELQQMSIAYFYLLMILFKIVSYRKTRNEKVAWYRFVQFVTPVQ